MKQLEVQIMGQSYVLGCPANGEARMFEAVHRVDIAMCKIRDVGKVKARDRIAVLAALNLVFEVLSPSESAEPSAAAAVATHHAELNTLLQRLDAALGTHAPPP